MLHFARKQLASFESEVTVVDNQRVAVLTEVDASWLTLRGQDREVSNPGFFSQSGQFSVERRAILEQ